MSPARGLRHELDTDAFEVDDHAAVEYLNENLPTLARRLKMSSSGASQARERGKVFFAESALENKLEQLKKRTVPNSVFNGVDNRR